MEEFDIHFGAKPDILDKARELRQRETKAEKVLWYNIRDRKINGLKFRRQHALDIFIADFYCHEIKLVVEIDGSIHDLKENQEYDIGRSEELNSQT